MFNRLFSLTCVQHDGRDPNEAKEGGLPAAGVGFNGKRAWKQASGPGKKGVADARYRGGGRESAPHMAYAASNTTPGPYTTVIQ